MINARLRPETTLDAIDRTVAAMTAATAELLWHIAEAEEMRLWRRDGATSLTSWLAHRYGVASGTARKWVRVAHALKQLPAIAASFEAARMSWNQLAQVTRFATPETDEFWARRAPKLRPKTLFQEAERRRRLHEKEVRDLRRLRYLETNWDVDTRMLHLKGALPPEDGAAFEEALNARAELLKREESKDEEEPTAEQRRADSLVELATAAPRGQAQPATLVVHAGAEVLTGEAPEKGPWLAETESGQRLATEQVRRLACDARIEWILEREGRPVGLGRRGRVPTAQMIRAIRHRDRSCVFPGCERKRWTQAHHVVHWANGGRTDLENLALLCHRHHRSVHEEGWRMSRGSNGRLSFHDPTGRPVRPEPSGLNANAPP